MDSRADVAVSRIGFAGRAPWETASPSIPQADSSGRATYELAANVQQDSVRFTVNGQPVTSVARSAVPTDGLAGVRINHNLHLTVTPVRVTR